MSVRSRYKFLNFFLISLSGLVWHGQIDARMLAPKPERKTVCTKNQKNDTKTVHRR